MHSGAAAAAWRAHTVNERSYLQLMAKRAVHQNGHWINPKSIGMACNAYHSGAGSCGEPIDLGSGNVFDQVTDYETAGQNKLSLIRYYNSMAIAGHLRHQHGHQLAHQLRPLSACLILRHYGVVAERPDGQQLSVSRRVQASTRPTATLILQLANPSGSTWTLTDRDDTVETYTVVGQPRDAQLHHAAQRLHAGPRLFEQPDFLCVGLLQPAAWFQLFVRRPADRRDDAGQPHPDLRLCDFHSSSQNLLTTVTYNTSPTTTLTYLYENASYPFALTGITDENGNRYATWGYDSIGPGHPQPAFRRGELHLRLLQRHDRQPRRQRPAWHCRNL